MRQTGAFRVRNEAGTMAEEDVIVPRRSRFQLVSQTVITERFETRVGCASGH